MNVDFQEINTTELTAKQVLEQYATVSNQIIQKILLHRDDLDRNEIVMNAIEYSKKSGKNVMDVLVQLEVHAQALQPFPWE